MKRHLIIICFIYSFVNIIAQDKTALEKSDSLFAKGVEYYNLKKYKEAIPLFTESDRIDKTQLDSTSNRRDYSAMWLASCYYKLGDTITAKNINDFYKFSPVDRRLTVQTDSLCDLLPQIDDLTTQIVIAEQIYEQENKIVEKNHPFSLNTLLTIAILHCINNDIKSSYISFNDIFLYTQSNSDKYLFDNISLKILFSYILNNSISIPEFNTNLELDKMLVISHGSIFEPDGYIWSELFKIKSEIILNEGNTDEYYKLIETIYNEFKNNTIINGNKYVIYSLMAKVLANKEQSTANQEEKETLCKARQQIYEELLAISTSIWGENSYEYGYVKCKIANLYLGSGLVFDLNKGKKTLIEAFNIITRNDDIQYRVDELTDLFQSAYIPFDIVGCSQLFIQYLKDVIEAISVNPYVEASDLKELLAHALLYGTHNDTEESIQLYSTLINGNKNNNYKQSGWLSQRAHGFWKIGELEKSLNDYLKLDSINENGVQLDDTFLARSNRNDTKKKISEIYLAFSDTCKSELFWKHYCSNQEKIIDDIVAGVYPNNNQYDQYKIEIIKDYAFSFLNLSSKWHSNVSKTIHFAHIALELLPELKINYKLKQEYECDLLNMLSLCYIINMDFVNGYETTTKLIESSTKVGDFRHLNDGLQKISDLFEYVSVEPELSLNYRLAGAESLSEYLINNRNNILKYEYITNRDKVYKEWNNCIQTFKYLGDEKSLNECYDKMFNTMIMLDGEDSSEYVEARMEWFTYYKIPQYYPWRNNDREEGITWINKMLSFFEKNKNLISNKSIFNYLMIGREYLYLNDYDNASKCFDLYEAEIKDNSVLQSKQIEYLELMECRSELFPEKSKEKFNALESLLPIYEKINEQESNKPHFFKYKYSSYLYNLCSLSHDLGLLDKERYYMFKILSELKDEEILIPIIDSYIQNDDFDSVVPLFERASNCAKCNILTNFKEMTSEQRQRTWTYYFTIPFNIGEGLAEVYEDKISSGTIYNNILMRKSFLLSASISAENLIKTEGDSLLLAKYERKCSLEDFLESKKEFLEYNDRIITREQAKKLVKRFDEEIMKRAAIIGDYTKSLSVDWNDVEHNIRNSDVVIEFTKFQSLSGKTKYGALIIEKYKRPIFCTLCSEDELKSVSSKEYYETDYLYSLVWKPLEEYIRGKSNIYFAPDGILYNIALEYIPNSEKGNISDSHNLYRLSSTRELAVRNTTKIYQKAALFGGMKYDTDTSFLTKDMGKYPELRIFERSALSTVDSLTMRGGVSYLPATGVEIDNIGHSFKQTTITPLLFKGLDGSEASFKSLSGNRVNIMHIATHGFYWTELEVRRSKELPFLIPFNDNSLIYNEDKALSRSGLLFSGANNILCGKPIPVGVEDGVLTAKEISQLDLRGLDLVVLSACQTGLGEISGDGVFGLQRGFKKAGANSLLMSLWKVDDRATQMLMTKFYEHFLSGKTKLESLALAQKYVREYEEEVEIAEESTMTASQQRRSKRMGDDISTEVTIMKVKPFADPKYWAAFILLDALN